MEKYLGYVTQQFVSDDEMIEFYNNMSENIFGLLTNQYVVLYNKNGELTDRLKWDGEKHVKLSYRQVDSMHGGKVKPRNLQQELAFDLLQDKHTTVKLLTGCYGAGKIFAPLRSNA